MLRINGCAQAGGEFRDRAVVVPAQFPATEQALLDAIWSVLPRVAPFIGSGVAIALWHEAGSSRRLRSSATQHTAI
jgi:hypothetical protein